MLTTSAAKPASSYDGRSDGAAAGGRGTARSSSMSIRRRSRITSSTGLRDPRGDCRYTGAVESHKDFEIRHADFNALVELLQIAMQQRKIPFRAQNKLLAKLAPMHREIINK